MGSKSIRDTDSSSASLFFPSQLRNSRRGSFASLASNTKVDKETLSQALDQIHSSASRSDALTTFNEYTSPPPSSSGPDSKGIASELQGGFSGLYTRIRASVGNVKDIVNLGSEAAGEETISVKSPKATIQSPIPSTNSGSEPIRVIGSSTATVQHSSALGSERNSPLEPKFSDPFSSTQIDTLKPPKAFAAGTAGSSKAGPGSLSALKNPPANLTQAVKPTTIGPALAEVNISAVKQSGPSVLHSKDTKGVGLATIEHGDRVPSTQKPHGEVNIAGEPKVAVAAPPDAHSSRKPGTVPPSVGNVAREEARAVSDSLTHDTAADGDGPVSFHGQISEDAVQQFPSIEYGETDDKVIGSSSDGDGDNIGSSRVVVKNSNPENDALNTSSDQSVSDANTRTVMKGSYQHLELPLRKSIASPVITRSHSPHSSVSRASISTIAESIIRSPLQESSHPVPTGSHELSRKGSDNDPSVVSTGGSRRGIKTMNVFSQVKNKVLNKEYWMKDENARDCFYCGDPFSTFRRKHHCSKSLIFWFSTSILQGGRGDSWSRDLRPDLRCEMHITDIW